MIQPALISSEQYSTYSHKSDGLYALKELSTNSRLKEPSAY